MGYGNGGNSSIMSAFTLSPLPYPVFLILALVLFLLSFSWSSSYQEAVESAEEQFNWALLASPILLLLAVHLLSSFPFSDQLFQTDWRRQTHQRPAEGPAPWGAAALIGLLFVMLTYQSTFHEKWFG